MVVVRCPRIPGVKYLRGGQASRSKTSEKVVIFGPVYNNAYSVTATARFPLSLTTTKSRRTNACLIDPHIWTDFTIPTRSSSNPAEN